MNMKKDKNIQQLLAKGETIKRDFSISQRPIKLTRFLTYRIILPLGIAPIIIALAFRDIRGLFMVIIALILVALFPTFLNFLVSRIHYILTNKRVIVYANFGAIISTIIDYRMITDIRTSQDFNARLYGMGNVYIESAGRHSPTVLSGVDNPYEVISTINTLRNST